MKEPSVGTVYLVGAGPGDPGLITRRGLELIHTCDVIVYDRLVAPELVDEAPPAAERIFAGKAAGGHGIDQAGINVLLVALALSGRKVVRLKGGDPFVFGRGAEEAVALASFGVPIEVVPGVSSAVAVPAYAGIPVTHRGASSSFAVVTAHRCGDEAGIEWARYAHAPDTLVLLMGVSALPDVTRALIDGGRDPHQPAAVIERGTTAAQRTVVGELSTIAALAGEASIAPPATTVIGEVVRLRETIAWFEITRAHRAPAMRY